MDSIALRDVRFCYGDVCAVEGVTFSVKDRSFTAVVGPNGGGKSTIVKLIAGLLKPDRGTVQINDGRKVGYVPQTVGFDRSFPATVYDFVLMGTLPSALQPFFRYGREHRERAEGAMDRVGLAGMGTRGIEQLSSGQLKKTLIARALASNADILLMDEPDESLDVQSARSLYEILGSLKGEKTIVAVSHRMDDVLEMADCAVYVEHGVRCFENPGELQTMLAKNKRLIP